MSVRHECCVMSGTVLCDGLIPRPEEANRVSYICVCDRETSTVRRPWLTRVVQPR
jgi:hypothetical protein